jgi:hypothetical protein
MPKRRRRCVTDRVGTVEPTLSNRFFLTYSVETFVFYRAPIQPFEEIGEELPFKQRIVRDSPCSLDLSKLPLMLDLLIHPNFWQTCIKLQLEYIP